MNAKKTALPGVNIIEPAVFEDKRGYFFESYNKKAFKEAGLEYDFVQDNQSQSAYGVLRGLHYQIEPYAQAKLIRVFRGKIFDVAVDIREDSPTFGQWYGEMLSAENKKQLLVPRGFAHGFVVLSEIAEVFYKCDNFYSKEHDRGIKYNDPAINIEWPIEEKDIILSEKDEKLPLLGKVSSIK